METCDKSQAERATGRREAGREEGNNMPRRVSFGIGLCVLVGLGLLTVSLGWADVPRKMNYQLKLTNAAGEPVMGACDLEFVLYSSETGDKAVWRESQSCTADTSGLITTILGKYNPLPDTAFAGSTLWLEVEVADQKIGPRRELTTAPYAFHAEIADSALTSRHAGDSDNLSGLPQSAYALKGQIADIDISDDANIDPVKIEGTALTKLNEGHGNNLNADKVDGFHAGELASAHNHDATYVNEGQDGSITSAMITDGAIRDVDVSASAAISPDKINRTGLNADLLDGKDEGYFAQAGHAHDDRYYTEGELNAPGTINDEANPVDWTKLRNVPVGFRDGNDNVGLDEAGIAGVNLGATEITLTGFTPIVVRQQSITPPAPGYVWVTATAEVNIYTPQNLRYDLSHIAFCVNSTAAWPGDGGYDIDVKIGEASENFASCIPVTVQRIFPVSSGSLQFYFLAMRRPADQSELIQVHDAQLTVIYFPTNYGTIVTGSPAAGSAGE